MIPCIRSLIRRASAPLLLLIILTGPALDCFADVYSDQGTVYITGSITDIQNQQICDLYDCHIGSTWSLSIGFLAPDWNAPGSKYLISTVLLNCFGGPPCINDYHANSDFGWGPYGFDGLMVDIENGRVVDARVACGGYFIEWGEADTWSYVLGFSGTTTGYAAPGPVPDPATFVTAGTGIALIGMRLKYNPNRQIM